VVTGELNVFLYTIQDSNTIIKDDIIVGYNDEITDIKFHKYEKEK